MSGDGERRTWKSVTVLVVAVVLLFAGVAGVAVAGLEIAHHLNREKIHCGPTGPGEHWNCPGPGPHPLARPAE